jgi:hypothetical protein
MSDPCDTENHQGEDKTIQRHVGISCCFGALMKSNHTFDLFPMHLLLRVDRELAVPDD